MWTAHALKRLPNANVWVRAIVNNLSTYISQVWQFKHTHIYCHFKFISLKFNVCFPLKFEKFVTNPANLFRVEWASCDTVECHQKPIYCPMVSRNGFSGALRKAKLLTDWKLISAGNFMQNQMQQYSYCENWVIALFQRLTCIWLVTCQCTFKF